MLYRFSTIKRLLCFIFGLALSGFGVAMSTAPGLGTSPISSLPYVLTFIVPLSLGTWTIFTNAAMVVGQIIVLKRDYHWVQLAQVCAAAVFGVFIDVGMWALGFIPFHWYWFRLVEQTCGCLLIAVGIIFALQANISYMPGEGLVKAISDHWRLNFGKVKIGFDVTVTALAATLSWIFCGRINGIREGTLMSAILVGFFIKQLVRYFRPVRKGLLTPVRSAR